MALEARMLKSHPLWSAAVDVLQRNDLGSSTKAAGALYPHQWSWDSAFIAMGLARVDPDRAAVELSGLLDAQWGNGKIPHIVFHPAAPPHSYWPGPRHWACEVPTEAPPGCTPYTSGLLQPPLHAIAAARLWQLATRHGSNAVDRIRAFLDSSYAGLMDWHAYLLSARDVEGSGLVTIYHPWESGMDNSPRWDQPLAAVHPLADDAPARSDLQILRDPSQRPLEAAYRRYRWLVELLRRHCYDDLVARASHPFVVKDVFASGLLVAANRALLRIARVVGARGEDRRRIRAWINLGGEGLRQARDPRSGLARDYDLRARRWLRNHTVGGFAELVAGTARGTHLGALVRHLESDAFAGDPRLRWAVPPSTSPLDPAFDPRRYWRGPTWPVITWLLWWALRQVREYSAASRLRQAGLDQIWSSGAFPEYLEPYAGQALGSPQQSWTAAVALDWLDGRAVWRPSGGDARGRRASVEEDAPTGGFVTQRNRR